MGDYIEHILLARKALATCEANMALRLPREAEIARRECMGHLAQLGAWTAAKTAPDASATIAAGTSVPSAG